MVGLKRVYEPYEDERTTGVGMAGSPMVGLKHHFSRISRMLEFCRNGRKPDGGIETFAPELPKLDIGLASEWQEARWWD